MAKIVSQLDAEGFFLAATSADPSPLEPGKFLIPGGAVDATPPNVPAGQRARWNGVGFDLEDIPPPPSPPPIPYADVKASILAQVRVARMPVLDALMGIAGRKHRGNKNDIADAIDIAAQGLLDLPNKASVQSATDEATLRAALKSEYDAIVLALAAACGADWPDVQTAFRAYDL